MASFAGDVEAGRWSAVPLGIHSRLASIAMAHPGTGRNQGLSENTPGSSFLTGEGAAVAKEAADIVGCSDNCSSVDAEIPP